MFNRAPDSTLSAHQALALGLLQGPTELLPISSSAHTALLPWLLGWSYTGLDPELRKSFEVSLHAGTGIALAIDMREELLEGLLNLDRRNGAVIACALAPPAIAGLALRRLIERRVGGPRSIAAGLIAGAVAMTIAEARAGTRKREDAGPGDGLALGLAQAVALIPGVSRSGATLTAARARGFTRHDAHALSWHAGLPVILGASALEAARASSSSVPDGDRCALAAGAACSFASTLASARVLRRASRGPSALGASLYRVMLALVVISRLRRTHNRRA